MHLKDVQKVLTQSSDSPLTGVESLKQLKAAVEKSLDYLQDGNTPKSQVYLEQGLTYMMLSLHYLNVDIEKAVQRQTIRQNSANDAQDRVILIFSDHAELRVSGEHRGTIPLYSPEDYSELRQIAHLFQCRLEHADHLQLDLFSLLSASPRSDAE